MSVLWKFYFDDITDKYLNRFYKGEAITIGRVIITQDAITIIASGVLKDDKKTISWEHLATKDYRTYFAIYSSIDAAKTNATFSYLKDWNTAVLFSVIRTILRDKDTKLKH